VQFESVNLESFMSYKKADFPIGKPGLYLIEGPNGVGKSSIPDAISWCLFGKTVRGLEGDAIVNRKIKENCKVEVKLTHRTYRYKITRYRKHHEFGNRLIYEKKGTITRDIKTVEMGTLAATEAALVDDLGIDFDLFQCTILFGQDSTFNFVNESNSEQKKILSKIMKVNFAGQHSKAKEELKTLASELIDYDKKLAVLESHRGDPAAKYSFDEADWETGHTYEILKAKTHTKTLYESMREIEKSITNRPREKFDELKVVIAEKMLAMNTADKKARDAISTRRARVQSLHTEIGRHVNLMKAGICPTCAAPVDAKDCRSQVETLRVELEEAETKVTEAQAVIDKIDVKKNQYLGKKESINDALYEITTMESNLKRAKTDYAESKVALRDLQAETNPWTTKIEEERTRQGEIEAKLKELTLEVKDLRDREPYLKFWVEAFGDNGIKSFIFDVICSGLTEKSNSYLNKLSNGEISISFDTQKKLKSGEVREKFDCQVITNGEAVDYKAYSGGEKTRISRAVDLGLSKIMSDQYGSEFNFVLFDEQTSYLNSEGRTLFFNLLRDLAKTQAVYVIDHDDALKAKFDQVIKIAKTREGSQICLS
jgi:DNA repair exonuclease SbcCD ATPase subunit